MQGRRLKISYKKTLKHPKADEQARSDFQNKIDAYESEGRTIVYLDESGFARDGPRTHGYCYRGKRSVVFMIGMPRDVSMLLVLWLALF